MRSHRARGVFATACLSLLGLAALGGEAATATAAFPGQGFLPDDRAWEMVSPPEKNGGEVNVDSQRTRAAADGDAVGFASMAGFGDVIGTGVAVDYIAVRSHDPDPGGNGWATHAVTPKKAATVLQELVQQLEPRYLAEYSEDLRSAVFIAPTSLAPDPFVGQAANLYRRDDLLTPGVGSYDLVTPCPLCESSGEPLVPNLVLFQPQLVWTSPDFEQVVFESERRLTADTPEGSDGPFLYEWDEGSLALAGRIPASPAVECDDAAAGPACVAAQASVGGLGAGSPVGVGHQPSLTPHTISDGSDGHTRVFLTHPLDEAGTQTLPNSYEGDLYMRVDGHQTVQLNVSERTPPLAHKRARFLDASRDGTRAFFASSEALTNGAPNDGQAKLYMYDATKPGSAADNLTRLSVDSEPKDPAGVSGLIGLSEDGRYVYFAATDQLVAGASIEQGYKLYLWHDGAISYIGSIPESQRSLTELLSSGPNTREVDRQARVSPDGRHLLFSSGKGDGLTGYDHGPCLTIFDGCREYYVYSADSGELQCASCNPSGAAATVMAEGISRKSTGGSQTTTHETNTLSDDGRYAFFSSAEKLVAEDVNGVSDAYLYDTTTGKPRLLSSGEDPASSYFLDASADGRDAFIVTREALSGWDVDGANDVYDARVGGGFPEPPPPVPACVGDACQPPPPVLDDSSPGSATVRGPGDPQASRSRKRCPNGKRKMKARGGRTRCVKRARQGRAAHGKGRAAR